MSPFGHVALLLLLALTLMPIRANSEALSLTSTIFLKSGATGTVLTGCTQSNPCGYNLVTSILGLLGSFTSVTFSLLDLPSEALHLECTKAGCNMDLELNLADFNFATQLSLKADTNITLYAVNTAFNGIGSVEYSFNAPVVVFKEILLPNTNFTLTSPPSRTSLEFHIENSALSGLNLLTTASPLTATHSTINSMALIVGQATLTNVSFNSLSSSTCSISGTTLTVLDSVFDMADSSPLSWTVDTLDISGVTFSGVSSALMKANSAFTWANSNLSASLTTDSAMIQIEGSGGLTSASVQGLNFLSPVSIHLIQLSSCLLNDIVFDLRDSILSSNLTIESSTTSMTGLTIHGQVAVHSAQVQIQTSIISSSLDSTNALEVIYETDGPLSIFQSQIAGLVNFASASPKIVGSTFTAPSGLGIEKDTFLVSSAALAILEGCSFDQHSFAFSSVSEIGFVHTIVSGAIGGPLQPLFNISVDAASFIVFNASSSLSGVRMKGTNLGVVEISASTLNDVLLMLHTSERLICDQSEISIRDYVYNNGEAIMDLAGKLLDFSTCELLLPANLSLTSPLPTVLLSTPQNNEPIRFMGSISAIHLGIDGGYGLELVGDLSTSQLSFLSSSTAANMSISGTLTLPFLSNTISLDVALGTMSIDFVANALNFIVYQANTTFDPSLSISVDIMDLVITVPDALAIVKDAVWSLGNIIFAKLPRLISELFDGELLLVDGALSFTVASVSCSPSCLANGGTCIIPNLCQCPPSFSGFYCGCPIPTLSFLTCDMVPYSLQWIANTSLSIIDPANSIILPTRIGLTVHGDLSLGPGCSLQVGAQSFVSVDGTLSIEGGSIRVATTAYRPPSDTKRDFEREIAAIHSSYSSSASPCSFDIASYLEASNLNLSSSSNLTIEIDMTSLSEYFGDNSGVECLAENPIFNVTGSSYIDGYITVVITGNPSNTRTKTDVIVSGDKSSSVTSTSLVLSVSTKSDSCSGFNSSPGIVSVFTSPCSGKKDKKSSTLKWWYYGIPIITVVALMVIIAIIILSVPKFRRIVVPYRGSRM